ncbi:SWIM zinc finger family protein [Roseateles sp. BYS96W]|uniref:SWIM zinc finger domain-containing protein n=1 Tax=Pelomonas nitida TaxID=3299027 RepID=A0ABW7G951_9BURK
MASAPARDVSRSPSGATEATAAQRQAWLAALADDRLADLTYPVIMERGRQILGSGAIQRPELQYTAEGQVAMLATIVGTEPYEVGVMLSGRRRVALESSCTCPHAEDGFFCKHQVALALRLRAELSGEAVEVGAAAARQHAATVKRAATVAAKTTALREFLLAQPSAALVERLMQLADEEAHIRRTLLAWQATSQASGDAKALGKLITQLLPAKDFLDWRDSNAYARSAAQVLPVLQGALQAQPPAQALHLAEQAYLRLQKQLADADDSGGQLGDVCAEVGRLWLQALALAGPQPAAFGDRYAAMRDQALVDLIPHAEAVAAMGELAARRYGSRLRERYESAAARPQPERSSWSASDGGLWQARHRYLEHLRAMGDMEEVLRALRTCLQTGEDHLALVEELDRLQRVREAVDVAQRAYRLFPQDWRVEAKLLELYERDGWDAEALAVREARFARQPSAENALAVLAAARTARQPAEPLRERMWQVLMERENQVLANWKPLYSFGRESRPEGPDVSERLAWLLQEQRLEDALQLAAPPRRAALPLLQRLAVVLPPERYEEAVPLLSRCFDASMPSATSPYADVLALVHQIAERLPEPRRKTWLDGLRQQYRAKRNFIKGLP